MNTSNLSNCAFPGNPHNNQNIPIILHLFVVLLDYPCVIPQSRQLFLQVLDPPQTLTSCYYYSLNDVFCFGCCEDVPFVPCTMYYKIKLGTFILCNGLT